METVLSGSLPAIQLDTLVEASLETSAAVGLQDVVDPPEIPEEQFDATVAVDEGVQLPSTMRFQPATALAQGGPRTGVKVKAALAPSIAVIGFGAAGIGFTNTLRNYRRFANSPLEFRPHITVFEGSDSLGGKMAPRNLGAQFLDARNFYPMDRIVESLGLTLLPPRGDYDDAPFISKNGEIMPARYFLRTVMRLRELSRQALARQPWPVMDKMGGVGFLHQFQRQGQLTAQELEAMITRLKLEEGTVRISALSLAINSAKGITPVKRLEVKGGLNRVAEEEGKIIAETGGEVLLGRRVRRIEAFAEGVRIFVNGKEPEIFDYALVSVAPEQLSTLAISGSSFPHTWLSTLQPARITKSNILLPRNYRPIREVATPSYAVWNSPHSATFFHGWEGQLALSPGQIANAVGLKLSKAKIESRIWDGRIHNGDLPQAYTTMPRRGEGWPMVQIINRFLINGGFVGERLLFANHVLGAGCYTRDAALAGEWSAIWLLKSLEMDISKVTASQPGRVQNFFGVDAVPEETI